MVSAEKYLNRIRVLEKKIPQTAARLRALEARATRMTAALDGMPRGDGAFTVLEDTVVRIADLRRDLEAWTGELIRARGEIAGLLRRLTDQRNAAVLEMYYLDGQTFTDIALEMGISTRWVRTLHARGVAEAGELLEEEQKSA